MLCLLIVAAAFAQLRTVNTLPASPAAIATDAQGFVYVAMNTYRADLPAVNSYLGHAVFSSSDLGTTWRAAGDLPDAPVVGIAADPAIPGTLVVTTRHGIWKSTDAGVHWRRVLSFPASETTPHDIAYDPAVPGHLLTVGYYSTDSGESWVPYNVPAATHWGPFAFDPKGSGVVLEGGYRSIDGGRTWSALPDVGPWRSFAFDSRRSGVVYGLGLTLAGVYVSNDHGETFSAKAVPFQNPRDPQYQDGVSGLFADPAHPGRIYVITDAGIMYRSDDVAQSWQKVYSGALRYSSLVIRTCSALVLANDPALVRSLDDGETWQSVGTAPVYGLASGAGCALYGLSGATQNGYVAKYTPGGEKQLWGAYVSGSRPISSVSSIAVAVDGSLAVGGVSSLLGADYAWASKLDQAGNTVFSRTFGDGSESAAAVAIDFAGAVWLAGATSSASFPVAPGAIRSNYAGGKDAYLAKLDAAGELVFATHLGTEGDDAATSLAIDSRDRAVVGGYFSSRQSIMLVRLDPRANELNMFTTPAASDSEEVDAVAIGRDDEIFATGIILSTSFPETLPPFRNTLNSSPTVANPCRTPGDRFLLRLAPVTLAPIYARRFGAECTNRKGAGLQVRPDGTALVATATDETFPQRGEIALQGLKQLAEIAPDGGSLLFSSPLPCCDVGLALEPDGSILAADTGTQSLTQVTLPSPPPISLDHIGNAFSGAAFWIRPGAIYSLTGAGIGPETPIWLDFDAQEAPTELGGSRVWFNDTAAQLLYASSNRLICLVPPGLRDSVAVRVEYAGSRSNAVQASVRSGDAGLLTTAFPGVGTQAYAENEDGSPNGPDNPAVVGSTVTFYATGFPPLPSLMGSPPSIYPALMNCQVSPAQDQRFVPGLYRIPCRTALISRSTGTVAVALQMARLTDAIISTFYTYFGNTVTIYVKSP